MKKKSSFRDKVSRDTQRQKTQASSYGYLKLPRNVSIFNPDSPGKYNLDFMPYLVTDDNHPDLDVAMEIAVKDTLWYKRPFKIHRNIGPNNETVVCLASIGKRCPICEYRSKRMKEGADKEETDALKISNRNLYAVIPLDAKGFKEEVHIWDIAGALFQRLLNEELEEDGDMGIFPDLDEGLTLRVRFDEKQLGKNKFLETSRIDFAKRDEVYDESILKDVPNLDEMLNVLNYKALEAKFMELEDEEAPEDTPEEVEDTRPVRRKKKLEGDEPEEVPEPEPERPKRKRPVEEEVKPVRSKKKVEDEPEEDPEPEEAKPTRRRKVETKDKGERCPHGHRFGKDADKFDECDSCEEWDACVE